MRFFGPILSCLVAAVSAQAGAGDWAMYAGDSASSKYSPLNLINKGNVHRARVVWRWASVDQEILSGNAGLYTMVNEATPIAIGGDLYVSTSLSQVAKIDGTTGRTIWKFDPGAYLRTPPPNLGYVHRGVTYWTDGKDKQRVVFGTGDGYLIALDAVTGQPAAEFGQDGRVDLLQGLAEDGNDWLDRWQYAVTSPVCICGDRLVVGASIGDLMVGRKSPPGDVRAYEIESGRLAWRFQTLVDESARWRGNTNVWTMMSVDSKLGAVYLPVSTAENDYYGAGRPGDNLHAESLVSVDCKTGNKNWHYQFVHHGLWDYDLPAAPNLVDIVVAGKPVAAVAQVTKQALAYVLDRETGKPVWPIEEREVPQSVVERAWPTQPIPSKPAAFDRQGVSFHDLINFMDEPNFDLCRGFGGQFAEYCSTPAEAANFALFREAEAIVDQYVLGPVFTPPSDRKKGTLQLPGPTGGASWAGAAFHPEKKLLFVGSVTKPGAALLAKSQPGADGTLPEFPYSYSLAGAAIRAADGSVPKIPLFKPPYGRVTAIDLNTGEFAWQKPIGFGPKHDPRIQAAVKGTRWEGENLGWDRRIQLLLTKELLFVGQGGAASVSGVTFAETDSGRFLNGLRISSTESAEERNLKAIDPDTGEILHEIDLFAGATSTLTSGNAYGAPMTYLNRKGKQVIVVPVGGANLSAELVGIEVEE